MDDVRGALRAYFASMTPDSRPMRPGQCPLVAAGVAWDNADATTRATGLVRAIDVYTRNAVGAQQWHRLTARDVLAATEGAFNGGPVEPARFCPDCGVECGERSWTCLYPGRHGAP